HRSTLMKNSTIRLRLLVLGVAVSLAIILSPASVKAQYSGVGNLVVTLDQATKYVQNFKQNPVAPSIKGGYFERNIFD
ncbi:MAG: hypothetical protein WBW71_11970, partial [Bacteroidota bacterium]